MFLTDLVQAVVTITPTTSPVSTPSATSTGGFDFGVFLTQPIATVSAALIAAGAAVWSAVASHHTGKKSAAASEKSAQAARDAVDLNKKTFGDNADRAVAEAFNERYQGAASQMGGESAAIRLAGVYAMSRLADDWVDQRQTCIDVLCAYLRMPPTVDGALPNAPEREVRRTIGAIIAQHFADDFAGPRWTGSRLNLRGAVLTDLEWVGLTLDAELDFRDARFEGINRWTGLEFVKRPNLSRASVAGQLTLERIACLETIDFTGVTVMREGSLIVIAAQKSRGEPADMNLSTITVMGRLRVTLPASTEPQADVYGNDIHVRGGDVTVEAQLSLKKGLRPHMARFDAFNWTVEPGSTVRLSQQLIDQRQIIWAPGGHQIDRGSLKFESLQDE